MAITNPRGMFSRYLQDVFGVRYISTTHEMDTDALLCHITLEMRHCDELDAYRIVHSVVSDINETLKEKKS